VGLLRYLRGDDLLDDHSESRALPPAENQLPLLGAYTASTVTPTAALAIADVWAAVRVLADAASSLPIHVYRAAHGGGRERVRSGRLSDLLDRPGPATSQADLVSSLMAHLAVYGNGYLAKYRQAGEITQLGLLHPDRVRPELQDGRLRFRYTPGTGPQQLLTEADVVHVKGLSVDGLNGLSAVSQAARLLGLSDELVKHALAYFDSKAAGGTARPAGVLRLGEGASFGAQDRTKEKIRAESRPHGILVIQGDAEYMEVASKLDDAQFVEQRRLAAQEIARVFRIPPHMLGAPSADSMTYSNVEQESIEFVRYSLTPWLRRIELAISNDTDLAFQRQYVKFELDGLLRADAKTRAEIYSLALDPLTGWMSRAEISEARGPRARAAGAARHRGHQHDDRHAGAGGDGQLQPSLRRQSREPSTSTSRTSTPAAARCTATPPSTTPSAGTWAASPNASRRGASRAFSTATCGRC
jgi:HK97 family phage portal protein